MEKERKYIAIDLKSFYASVECVERGLNPLTASLVVADENRTEKTICLAVSPALKARGVGGRARLFEVLQKVKREEFIVAMPRMQLYLDYSTRINNIYLNYVAPDDIHVYSVDEVFMDVTDYLSIYKLTAHELAVKIIRDVLRQTGITATAGIGTNLYLCKVAMDVVAKHIPADEDGVRIAELDEMSYRRLLWAHEPITDFWRVGKGTVARLSRYGIYTMGDVAMQSVEDENLLYHLFGVGAELLIDHAWGWEPCTIKMIKSYRPQSNSLSSGQVLTCPYDSKKARVVIQEMADGLAMELFSKHLVTDQIVITINYDKSSLAGIAESMNRTGEISFDHYGRMVPKSSHGTENLDDFSSSSSVIIDATKRLYDRIVKPSFMVRRLAIVADHVMTEEMASAYTHRPMQLDLFEDKHNETEQDEEKRGLLEKEHRIQQTVLDIKRKFGKNSILKGLNFEEGATAKERNRQIGGHRA